MRFSTTSTLTLLLATVSAQNFGDEPACAVSFPFLSLLLPSLHHPHSTHLTLSPQIPCLESAIAQAGCGLTDQACQCGASQLAIQSAVTPCLLSSCNSADLQKAASVGFALCAAYSATAMAGSANVTATETGSAMSSSDASGILSIQTNTAVYSSAAGSSSPSGIMSTTYSAAISSMTNPGGAMSSAMGSNSSSVTRASSRVPSSASSALPVATTNAAPAMRAGMVGGLMGALVGAVAIL